MTAEPRAYALALGEEGREHDASLADRLDRLRNLEDDSARLLALLATIRAPKRALELGTSNGVSTIWLADALRRTGGRLRTVELEAERSAAAGEHLAACGLADVVELVVGDAGAVLAEEPDAAYGLVFLDAERPAYPGYWEDLIRVLEPGGLLVVDNVRSHADQVAPFRELVEADAHVDWADAPSGAGLLLIAKLP
ncbi:Putative O-methyltransferase [Pseudoclavibacter triregionum]|nr:Putative O-methyltransferase [Pseudoclavibacter triregionum]